jgi:hypothetical protein
VFIIWTPLKTLLLGLDHHVFIFCVLHIFPSLIWYLSGRNHGFLAVSICAIFDLFEQGATVGVKKRGESRGMITKRGGSLARLSPRIKRLELYHPSSLQYFRPSHGASL